MPAILCPNEPVINIGRPLGKGHSGRKGLRDGGDESLGWMLEKLVAAELTSHFQLFHQRGSKVVIVAAKDILSELSIFWIF